MTDDIGFLTSFSPDLFEATGRNLLHTHRILDPQRYMLACIEAGFDKPLPDLSAWPVATYDLGTDPFLAEWLALNRDIIPDYLGGIAKECNCPGHEERHAKHKHGCHWSWMNRNASRFFRKVAAWRHAAANWPYRYMIWLDSDCIFVKPISVVRLQELLKGAAMAYFRGRRPAPETGILLFDFKNGANDFIQRVCDCYMSGRFRNEERWDDGYIVGRMLNKDHFYRDLVNRKRQRGNHVIPQTEVAEFFAHLKGSHGTRLDLMR